MLNNEDFFEEDSEEQELYFTEDCILEYLDYVDTEAGPVPAVILSAADIYGDPTSVALSYPMLKELLITIREAEDFMLNDMMGGND